MIHELAVAEVANVECRMQTGVGRGNVQVDDGGGCEVRGFEGFQDVLDDK